MPQDGSEFESRSDPEHQVIKDQFRDLTSHDDWEIYLDENLEVELENAENLFEDEDPLENGKIIDYATRLSAKTFNFRDKEKKNALRFYITCLGNFPYYQSYNAIEKLLNQGHSIDHIIDTYITKLLWACNPFLWSRRKFNRLEKRFEFSRHPELRNSMSWRMASDLVINYPVVELENLILVDWYNEWSVLKPSDNTIYRIIVAWFILNLP